MKTHVRYHPLKFGGLSRCVMPVSSMQKDGRWVIRCILTREKGSLFCKDHRPVLSTAAPRTLSNLLKVWVTPLGVYPRAFDTRCSCWHEHLVWMYADPKDIHPRCVIHGGRS